MRLGSSRSKVWQLLLLIAALAVAMATWRYQLERMQPASAVTGELRSSDAEDRREAVHKLGRMGSSQVVGRSRHQRLGGPNVGPTRDEGDARTGEPGQEGRLPRVPDRP